MLEIVFFIALACAITYKILVEIFLHQLRYLYPTIWQSFGKTSFAHRTFSQTNSVSNYLSTGKYREIDNIGIKRLGFAANIIGLIGLCVFIIFLIFTIYYLAIQRK